MTMNMISENEQEVFETGHVTLHDHIQNINVLYSHVHINT